MSNKWKKIDETNEVEFYFFLHEKMVLALKRKGWNGESQDIASDAFITARKRGYFIDRMLKETEKKYRKYNSFFNIENHENKLAFNAFSEEEEEEDERLKKIKKLAQENDFIKSLLDKIERNERLTSNEILHARRIFYGQMSLF